MIDQRAADVVTATSPPDWWPDRGPDVPLFASRDWLQAFADVRSHETHFWMRTGGTGPETATMVRGTLVGRVRPRRSLNPHHWMFEQTAYRDGVARPGTDGVPPLDSVLPSMTCVFPGLEFRVLGRRDPAALATLVRTAAATARQAGCVTLSIGFVQPDDELTATVAVDLGFTGFTMATLATFHVAGQTAQQAFASYSSKQRASFHRTRRRLAEQRVTCTVLDHPRAELNLLTELRCRHLSEHGRSPNEQEERRHLAVLFEEFGDLVTVLVGRRGNRIHAFSLFLRDGDVWHSYMVGRQDAKRDRDVYFELNYYLPLEIAAREGVPRISYGYGTEEAKRLRGCAMEPVRGYVLRLDDALPKHAPQPRH